MGISSGDAAEATRLIGPDVVGSNGWGWDHQILSITMFFKRISSFVHLHTLHGLLN
jgi:hypothetical protein